MKKLFTLVLVVLLVVSLAPAAFAANATPGSTTLTTTVPDAEYTLNIPADQTITFGATSTEIGNVTITDAKSFANGKNVKVTVTYDAFTSPSVKTTIPFTLKYDTGHVNSPFEKPSGESFVFSGKYDGTVEEKASLNSVEALIVYIASSDWGKALAGDYTATIAFTAEVVAEE